MTSTDDNITLLAILLSLFFIILFYLVFGLNLSIVGIKITLFLWLCSVSATTLVLHVSLKLTRNDHRRDRKISLFTLLPNVFLFFLCFWAGTPLCFYLGVIRVCRNSKNVLILFRWCYMCEVRQTVRLLLVVFTEWHLLFNESYTV